MSDNTETLGIVLRADGVVETTNGVNLTGKAVEDAGRKFDAAGKPIGGTTQALQRSGVTAGQTAAAWRMLPAQITDVATSLASGMPVWLVAIQQGGQLKDSFGGVGPMFRELSSALTLGRVAIGGTALAVGALLLAHEQGAREGQAYARSLIMTGNAAGGTRDQLASIAGAASQAVGSQRAAAEATAALAGTGEVARRNLQDFTETAVRMERELATPIDDTARRFQDLGRAPLEASLRLNRGVNYLTAAIYEQIRALMAEGKVVEAGAVAQRAYSDAMNGRAKQVQENLGWLEKGWRLVGDVAKFAWDRMLDVGREDTLDQKLAKARRELEQMSRFDGQRGVSPAERARRSEKQAEIDALLEVKRLADSSAQRQAEQTAERQEELRQRERANVEAGLAVDLARASSAAAQRQALAERDLAVARASGSSRESLLVAQTAALEDLRGRDGVSLADYYERRAQLEREGLAVEIANVDAEIRAAQRMATARAALLDDQISAERRRQPENPAEAGQQQARLLELTSQRQAAQLQVEARVIELTAQRGRLTAQQIEAEVAGQRAITAASAEATARYVEDVERRRQALAQTNDQQRQANAAAAVDLIADPYTRATARARLDIEELNRFYAEQLTGLKARLPALETSDPEEASAVRAQILTAEQQKNDAIVLRARQLTEELKPEWAKQLEAWQDHTRLMRESYDEFQNGWLASGRSAWAEYMRTGKLSLDSLGSFIRQQAGDLFFKQVIAKPLAQVGGGIAELLGFGKGVTDTAETAARALNTSTLQANTAALMQVAAALGVEAAGSGGEGVASAIGSMSGSGIWGTLGTVAQGLFTNTGLLGGLAAGGPARAGGMYEVNEQGPELLTVNSRTYLMMGGKDGFVTPNGGGRSSQPQAGGGTAITYAPVINIDARTDKAQVEQLVARAVRSGQVELQDMISRRQV